MPTPTRDPFSASALFDTYNQVMATHGLEPLPFYRYRSLRQHLDKFGEFCRAKQVDPERWLLAKGEATGWKFRPRIRHLANHTETFMANFQDWGDGMQAEAQSQDRIAGQVVNDGPGPDGLRWVFEMAKRAFVTDPGICLVSYDVTGGYNPGSKWCGACPLSGVCRRDTEARNVGR